MNKLMRKWLGYNEIDEARDEMFKSATKAAAASGLIALSVAQNQETLDTIETALHSRHTPLFFAPARE